MCGIAGFLENNDCAADQSIIQKMTAKMVHRGPDDEGYYQDGPLAFGFRRLSIIDLGCGHQPLISTDRRYAIIFNGEIYNYTEIREQLTRDHDRSFQTQSDTEVVLQAYMVWGRQSLERFNGMFAFAVWDATERQLFLARDRAGKKPLYYTAVNDTFVFASEIKVLLQYPGVERAVDPTRIPAFLTYRYVPLEESLFQRVHAIPAGHYATLQPGGTIQIQQYWDLPLDERVQTFEPEGQLVAQTETLLEDAVRLRMIADVPFGAFLSGGLDSSVIVGLMARLHEQPIKTFSIGFDTGFSEHVYAAEVARHFKCDHEERIVSSDDILRNIPRVLHMRETPISEPSDLPIYLLSEMARRKVTVVLSGEGSDEVFAGYPKYAFQNTYGGILGAMPSGILKLGSRALPYKFRRLQLALECLAQNNRFEKYACWFGGFPSESRKKLLAPGFAEYAGKTSPHQYSEHLLAGQRNHSPLDEMLYLDLKHWLPSNLLLRGDRMTMGNSIELRCPFLDYRLMEFAARKVPSYLKTSGLDGKIILKHVAEKLLPQHILQRKKWGFKVPIADWFRGPLKKALHEILLSPRALDRGYFNESFLQNLVREHIDGRVNHEKQLWILFQLEMWHLMFLDQVIDRDTSLENLR